MTWCYLWFDKLANEANRSLIPVPKELQLLDNDLMQLWDDKLFQPIISLHFGKSFQQKQNQVSLLKFKLLVSAVFTQAIPQNRSPDLVTREIKKGGKRSDNNIVLGQFLSLVKKWSKNTEIWLGVINDLTNWKRNYIGALTKCQKSCRL